MVEALITLVVVAVLGLAVIVLYFRRRKVEEKGAQTLKLALAEGQQVPLSLHPVIDPNLCVGSFSCIKACPEGEIIGIVDGVATLVEAAHCIGHGSCAVECPVGAIKLVYGTAERGIDLPETDDVFETSKPGVYVIGELGGMGLIKNALRQGLLIGKTLKQRLKRSEANAALTDVVIIGGGPAGIAAAVSCHANGLHCRVLEQETLGGAIAHYPRGKVVMTEQIVMPNYGPFGRSLLSKEDLLTELKTLVKNNRVKIEEGQRVIGVSGDAPFLSVTTQRGDRIQCRAVVLAIGLRGTPRKLEVPGEERPNVTYRLVDPEQYHGQRVLVVGGGDSAVEAAIQLAEESTAKVYISYRGKAFTKIKPRNKERINRLIDEGRVKALFQTRVISIEDGIVRLSPVLTPEEEKKRDEERRREEAELRAEQERLRKEEEASKKLMLDNTDPEGIQPADQIRPGTGRVKLVDADDIADPDFERNSSVRMKRAKEKAEAMYPPREKSKTNINVGSNSRALNLEDPSGSMEMSRSVSRSRFTSVSSSGSKAKKDQKKLKNNHVIVAAGGQLPTEFLESIGVGTRRYHGDEKGGGAGPAGGRTKAQMEARSRRRLAFTLFAIGGAIISGLLLIGQEYYWLPLEERAMSPLHSFLKPSGLWGHGVGWIATTFMIANFLYAVRKRWRKLKGTASIRTWLTFHMFVGIMSPLVIAFHAAFLVNNLLAVYTWLALSVVVATGIFGRFLFSFVPAQAGKVLAVSELREQVNDIGAIVETRIKETTNIMHVTQLFNVANTAPGERNLLRAVLREGTVKKKLMQDIEGARPFFKDEGAYKTFKEGLVQISRARLQISFYATLKRVFRAWLVIHVVVAVFMVVLIGAHVAVTTYLGFTWIFGDNPS